MKEIQCCLWLNEFLLIFYHPVGLIVSLSSPFAHLHTLSDSHIASHKQQVKCGGSMEEVQCALLGFGSTSLPSASTLSSSSPSSHSHPSSAGIGISATLREQLHPTEYALMMQTLPLGSLYVTLKAFANDGAAGRLDGYVISATAMAVSVILEDYEAAVDAIRGIADLSSLSTSFGESFHALVRVTHHAHELPVFLLLVQQLLSSLDLPLSVRACVGEHVSTTVLFCVAHFAAHGVVLEGRRKDFFIQKQSRRRRKHREGEDQFLFESDDNSDDHDLVADVDSASGQRSPKRYSSSSSNLKFAANKRLIPCGLHMELVNTVIQAGNTRNILRQQLRRYGTTRLRNGDDDDATAKAIFASIYNAALTRGGRLVVEELAVRIEAARSIWSKALWDLVGGGTQHLVSTVRLLRDAFLGHRGDLWGTFVDVAFPVLINLPFLALSSSSSSSGCASSGVSERSLLLLSSAAGGGGGAASSTKGFAVLMDRAYQSALRAVGLDDTALAHSVSLSMDIPAPVVPSTIQEAAETITSRIQMIFLTVDLSAGTELVIAKHTLDRYHALFCFQLGIRFALHALHVSRKQLQELVLGPQTLALSTPGSSRSGSTSAAVGGSGGAAPSSIASWKHAMSRIGVLLHFYTFVLSTVGQYFQVDVIEGHYSPLVAMFAAGGVSTDVDHARQQRRKPSSSAGHAHATAAARVGGAQSVEEARVAHERALLEVSDAMFYFDNREDYEDEHRESGGLVEALESATHTAFALFCLIRRCASVAMNLGDLSSSSSGRRGGGSRDATPLTSEVLTSISFLERSRNELIIGIASQLSKSSNSNERSLWARLDFNKFISSSWHQILRGGSATTSGRSASSAAAAAAPPPSSGVPLSLGSLAASHRGSSSSGGRVPIVTTKLQSVSLSRSSSLVPPVDGNSQNEADYVQTASRADF
ncbi:spindle-pole body protein, putative [Bodo saltans]|uniref:Spindle pole body component n=1 Tax=Bodo saltans TaxID=75058 RepID=A0A0S4JBA6_BODSA|nr:spindle-pole body protein, putative [Bodo saltans]|eukprot:CUG87299.1 spindle-pole body protein, putative [Bodo saltans]